MKQIAASFLLALVGCYAPCDCQIHQSKMDALGPPETIHRVKVQLILEDIVPVFSGEEDYGLSA